MKIVWKLLLVVLFLLVLLAAGGFVWARGRTADLLGRTIETHAVDFPVPFPLDSAEVAESGLSHAEAEARALEHAVDRGRHLVEARYGCTDCHGADFGGGVMVDDPAIGRLLGPNITAGQGGRTAAYGPSDWDRIVRHGVKPDGAPAAMPSQDFGRMTDQELSDIVAYIGTVPAVDATVPPVELGPLGTVLVATGRIPLSADMLEDHHADHVVVPPEADETVEFGRHIAGPCMGCHRRNMEGGPIPGGDPSWPPAANLTPHADALGEWSYEDFTTAMMEARRPDGTVLLEPMSLIVPYAHNMTDTELRALWAFLRSVPPLPPEG